MLTEIWLGGIFWERTLTEADSWPMKVVRSELSANQSQQLSKTEKDTPKTASVTAGSVLVQMNNDINQLWETWITEGGIWILWEGGEWKIWLSLQSYLQNNRWNIILLFISKMIWCCYYFYAQIKVKCFFFRSCICSKTCSMQESKWKDKTGGRSRYP